MESQTGDRKRPTIVQVEAAKLRLVTDHRLGKVSPEWLKQVALGLLPERMRDPRDF